MHHNIIQSSRKILLVCIGILVLFAGYLLTHVTNSNTTVTSYSIPANITTPFRVVQLTDLHNAVFGEENRDLIDLVAEQDPDIIVMTGDMLNRYDKNLELVCDLIASLTDVAPVYYGYGNHETAWEETWSPTLTETFSAAGAIVLNNDYIDTEICGNAVRIGGYMGYYRQPGMTTTDVEQKQLELAFFDDFEGTERCKILLNHIPTSWVDWGYIDKYPVDLIFSGHYHGGQWVLPFIGALYAPYIGFDPPYVKGVFEGDAATCVLSSGLGNERPWLPRINNPPEIVVVDLVPKA